MTEMKNMDYMQVCEFLQECLEKGYDLDNEDLKCILNGDFDSVRYANEEIPDEEVTKLINDHKSLVEGVDNWLNERVMWSKIEIGDLVTFDKKHCPVCKTINIQFDKGTSVDCENFHCIALLVTGDWVRVTDIK